MEKLIMTLANERGGYSLIEASGWPIELLGLFLTNETGGGADSWKGFLLDPKLGFSSANVTYLMKQGSNICIGDLLVEGGPLFCMPLQDFIKVLEKWDELHKQKVSKIIITQAYDGKIAFEIEP